MPVYAVNGTVGVGSAPALQGTSTTR